MQPKNQNPEGMTYISPFQGSDLSVNCFSIIIAPLWGLKKWKLNFFGVKESGHQKKSEGLKLL